MITLPYSLVIEATKESDFFGFYSPDLEGFTGFGHSIEDCLYKARSGVADHVQHATRARLSGACEQSQSDNRDSERGEIAASLTAEGTLHQTLI